MNNQLFSIARYASLDTRYEFSLAVFDQKAIITLAPHEIGPCRRAPYELSVNSHLISAGSFGAGNQLTTGVHRQNALKIASPNKLSSRELELNIFVSNRLII